MSIRPGLLTALLRAGHLHGAIRWKVEVDIDASSQELIQFGYLYRLLDTTGVTSIEEFFDVANKQLELSGEANLVASNFESALNSLPKNTVIVWLGWQDFARQAPNDVALVADIFDAVAQGWEGSVLILGKAGTIANVAELSAVS